MPLIFIMVLDVSNTCFLKDTNIDAGTNDLLTESGITSPDQCQEMCQWESQCWSFVWHKGNKCYLKTGSMEDAKQYKDVDSVSGPKQCGEINV